jgi:hypothetical protein
MRSEAKRDEMVTAVTTPDRDAGVSCPLRDHVAAPWREPAKRRSLGHGLVSSGRRIVS